MSARRRLVDYLLECGMNLRFLIYNMSGELDDMSHLFPNERLARLAAVLGEQGGEVSVCDRANLDDLVRFGPERLKNLGELAYSESNELYDQFVQQEAVNFAGRFDVVLLNLFHGSGFKFSADFARVLKSLDPAVRIYGVGQKVDWFKEAILQLPDNALDGLITGLGYNAARRLSRGEGLAGSPNTIMWDGERVSVNDKEDLNVDDFPDASYDPRIYETIGGKLPVRSITLSNQACPNYCSFCLRPDNYGRRNIRRTVGATLAEMEALFDAGITHFRVEDSTPPANALSRLAQALLDSKLRGKVKLSAFSRVDTNRDEDFYTLREAGVLSLFFGVEAMDDEMLEKLGKGFSTAQVLETVRSAHDAGIRTVGSFIYPMPGQTRAQADSNLEGIRALAPYLDSLLALPGGVYPPTDWGRNPEKYGIVLDEDFLRQATIYPIKSILPLKYWPQPPFSYELFGKPAESVTFADIVAAYDEFIAVVRNDLNIPAIPDYYFLIADLLGADHASATGRLVKLMVTRDYEGVREMFEPVIRR